MLTVVLCLIVAFPVFGIALILDWNWFATDTDVKKTDSIEDADVVWTNLQNCCIVNTNVEKPFALATDNDHAPLKVLLSYANHLWIW